MLRPARGRLLEGVFLGCAALITWASYENALGGPFIFDDRFNVQLNAAVHLKTLSLDGLMHAAFGSTLPSRPLANVTFALNFYLHGFDFFGYHLVNLALHLGTGLALYGLSVATLRLHPPPGRSVRPELVAGLATLLWLVHPLHTQTVSYIVQRMNGMASMFFVVALYSYVRGRLSPHPGARYALFTTSALCGVLAVASKETSATLPFVIVLYEWFFFRDLSPLWLRRGLITVAAGALLVASAVALRPESTYGILDLYDTRSFTMGQRLLTEPRVVFHYLGLLVFPHPSRLALMYDYPVSTGLLTPPTTLPAILGVFALIGGAFWLAPRERLWAFAILWWFGNLFIESSFIGLELVFEHRTYLPSMFLVVAFVATVFRLVPRRALQVGICGVLILVGALWTHERNYVWADDVACYRDNLAKAPHVDRIRKALAFALTERGRVLTILGEPHRALGVLEEALALADEYGPAHHFMGFAQAEVGNHARAVAEYRRALEVDPEDPMLNYRLARSLHHEGKRGEALASYSAAGRLSPQWPAPIVGIGSVLLELGRVADATKVFEQGLQIAPASVELQRGLQAAKAAAKAAAVQPQATSDELPPTEPRRAATP